MACIPVPDEAIYKVMSLPTLLNKVFTTCDKLTAAKYGIAPANKQVEEPPVVAVIIPEVTEKAILS